MKEQDLETSLKRAYEYSDGGRTECLHVASPRILNVPVAMEKLREISKEVDQ